MKYEGRIPGGDAELSIEREGLRLGGQFIDYADVSELRPINHRIYVVTLYGEQIEISMLGHSFDGFWEELTAAYAGRCLEALFVEEERIMLCEGEYAIPGAAGRAKIALYTDSVCILPPDRRALRIPLCGTREITLNGYTVNIVMGSGACFTVGRMGYDTHPFAERAAHAADLTKKERAQALAQVPLAPPFNQKGLFRTRQTDIWWNAAVTDGRCALELFTKDDAATYLYRFSEPREVFLAGLRDAAEAVGTHRELIYLTDEQIAERPLCRMSAASSEAVRYLRARSDGRLIHSAGHAGRLADYLSENK